jgi:phage head maturation protease
MSETQESLFENEKPSFTLGKRQHIFTKKVDFQTGPEGTIKGVGLLFGKVPDRPMVLVKGAFDESCGSKVPLVKGHKDEGDFIVVGSARVICNGDSVNLDGQFDLSRDPETKQFMVPVAAEVFSLTKNDHVSGISAGIRFDEDGIEWSDDGIVFVNKAEITEFSIVVNAAIPGAKVTEVMNKHREEVNVNGCPNDPIALRAAFIRTNRRLRNA